MQNITLVDNGKSYLSRGLATTCGTGHYFVWAGDPNHELPEGYPCACGLMKWHTEICVCCGSKVIKPIPR